MCGLDCTLYPWYDLSVQKLGAVRKMNVLVAGDQTSAYVKDGTAIQQ